jgi:4-hydroxybenzoate polyprenyltransferase
MESMSKATFRDYLMLTRAPLAFTALADGLVGLGLGLGALDKGQENDDLLVLIFLVALSSSGAYLAGMVFNDFFDRERDKSLNPKRPLPAGRISVRAAVLLGAALLLCSSTLAYLTNFTAWLWHGGLLLSIFAYDAFLKRYRIPGALAMAACRGFNILFGAAAVTHMWVTDLHFFTENSGPLMMALASFTYIFALTMLSTYEDKEASKAALFINGFLLLLAPTGLTIFHLVTAPVVSLGASELCGLSAGCVLCCVIFWLLRAAWKQGTRATGHNTTRWLIRGTLLLGAGALLSVGEWRLATFNLALAAPYVLGARWLFRAPKIEMTSS